MPDNNTVLPFPNLCAVCQGRKATTFRVQRHWCDLCLQDYERGARRLKRVVYKIQKEAKIGRLTLKGVACLEEGPHRLKLRISLSEPISHKYGNLDKDEYHINVASERKSLPDTPQQPVQQKLLPAPPVVHTRRPLILMPPYVE